METGTLPRTCPPAPEGTRCLGGQQAAKETTCVRGISGASPPSCHFQWTAGADVMAVRRQVALLDWPASLMKIVEKTHTIQD